MRECCTKVGTENQSAIKQLLLFFLYLAYAMFMSAQLTGLLCNRSAKDRLTIKKKQYQKNKNELVTSAINAMQIFI